MKKRLLSLLLAISMALSILPVTALAAVGDLVRNTPSENESLLEQLEGFTGETYGEAYDLLNTLGLLDKDGNLITDQTIDLDGKSYTLEEVETLLSDPDTDLTRVAEVDGVPISLSDLKTVIAIERELQYLQEKYFSGATFEGEALENVNSLLSQLQSEGMTLSDTRSAGVSVVFNTTGEQFIGGNTQRYYYYISTGQLDNNPEVGTTLRVKFRPRLTDGLSAAMGDVEVSLRRSSSDLANSEVLTSQSIHTASDANQEYELSYTVDEAWDQPQTLYLAVSYSGWNQTSINMEYLYTRINNSFGNLAGAVSFYEPEGFLFDGQTPGQYHLYFQYTFSTPGFVNEWTQTEPYTWTRGGNQVGGIQFQWISGVTSTQPFGMLNATMNYLDSCKDNLTDDTRQRFQLTTTISQKNEQNAKLMISANMFNTANGGKFKVDIAKTNEIADNGFPIDLPSSDTQSTTLSMVAFGQGDLPKNSLTEYPSVSMWTNYYASTDDNADLYSPEVTPQQSTTSGTTIKLLPETTAPTLTVTATPGTYQSGDLIPVKIGGSEYIKADENTQISVNGEKYTLKQLHGSTSGKYISFLYEVREFDDTVLTVGAGDGITDYWNNAAVVVDNEKVSGVQLRSPVLKNAVSGFTAEYAPETSSINFDISVKQEGYQNLYNTYQGNEDGAMRLMVSVDGGEAQAHTVTMGKGSNNDYAFTAQPYSVKLTDKAQTVTAQLQVKDGDNNWVTVSHLTATVTVPAMVKVTKVTIPIPSTGTTLSLSNETQPKLEAQIEPSNATYKTGTWYSSNETIATIDKTTGQISLMGNAVGEVEFWYVANNGTLDGGDDKTSNKLKFNVVAGDELSLLFPKYAQDTLVREGNDATVKWNTNAMVFYPDEKITFTVNLYKGSNTTEEPVYTGTVTDKAELTIPADSLEVDYPQSQYTVTVSMEKPEARSAQTTITVLSKPTEMRIAAEKTAITDSDQLTLNCTISNTGAKGELSVTRMTESGSQATTVTDCLSNTQLSNGGGAVTFTPQKVDSGLYDTYTITFTEQDVGSENFAPSSDSMVVTVYRSGALKIEGEDTINLSNASKVDGSKGALPTDSQEILALRQELGLIEYVSINADDYNWSSFSDGIEWVSDHPEAVGVYYRQGGLWDNIEDLPYKTYLPQSQMAVAATADGTATITATHAATGMSDKVTVNVNTLRDQFYLFQVTPAEKTAVTYTDGKGETKTVYTNDQGILALYEPNTIASDVMLRSGSETEPNLGTIFESALVSGERDAAKMQLYPLNTITLVPAAKAELYLAKPDGTPYVGKVTLRGGVYLGGYYCEGAMLGSEPGNLAAGNTDKTYTADSDGKLTVYMDATQFQAEEYTGQLTNAALEYWFELRMANGAYYPKLVNIQGAMSADRILRTGSAVVMLEEVPEGQENEPYLTAQTLTYGKESGEALQVRDVMGSTGKVGPNSTYPYAELTSYFTLWGVNADEGKATVSMTGDSGFILESQTVEDSTFPFASVPIITNTMVLTKETMTESGWLQPETAASLRAGVYQNGKLVKNVSMPFQVIDLTDVKLVNEDAEAVVVDMQTRFLNSIQDESQFTFGDNSVGSAFSGKITDMLNQVQETGSPLFRVLITPSEDNTVFNVLIWGGYDSLDLKDFDHNGSGVSMDYELLDTELQVGVPGVGDISEMAQGTYDPMGTANQNQYNRTNSGLDLGAQLEGYYEGQFYYDTDLHQWAFRTTGGGMTAGTGVSFEANVNAWVGPIPITATFGAGLALQLDFKAATVYTDQQSASTLSTWTDEARSADSVNDFLTTLRINGYVNAFGGVGFDYSVLALKIGLFGKLTADSENVFLSRTYLKENSQINGQAVGVTGEVGIKFVAKFLFISYEAVLGSGKVSIDQDFNKYTYINDYWNGTGGSNLQMGTATLLSRDYLRYYADGQRAWNPAEFQTTATVVQEPANPGSEPVVNDDGSRSVYISDMGKQDYFASRIKAGAVGEDGTVIDDKGYGDMSPSLSGDSAFTAAAWVRLQENLQTEEGETTREVTPAEQKQLLNSTEIMVATTTDGINWSTETLTDNATPDLAPVTASNGSEAVVFWRSVYLSNDDALDVNTENPEKLTFDTQDAIYYSRYDSTTGWSEAQMVYNGSAGGVVGIQSAMLENGTSIVLFTVDRNPDDNNATDYEVAYRTVNAAGRMGDLVMLTNDSAIDNNPQVTAVTEGGTQFFVLGWYSTQDGGDIRLQSVGADGQLYSGSSPYAVPASVNAITGQDDLRVSADFRFAKRTPNNGLDGLTLVWAETVDDTTSGTADHSVLYGTRLCRIDDALYLSSPQVLTTLLKRTLANSFSAWQDSSGKVSAYIFGTWYDPEHSDAVKVVDENGTETTVNVPQDTDQLLTGGGTFTSKSVSVESILVDYANLQIKTFTPVVFTLRNTGTAKLTDLTVTVGSAHTEAGDLYPGESTAVTVMYETGGTIDNPSYAVTANSGTGLTNGTLHLDYNDVGISSMEVLEENNGQRTMLVTLYNDAAAQLKGSNRTVELSFYSDAAHSIPANVDVSGQQSDVSVDRNKITLSGDDILGRIDQGSMTLLVTYDLADYVTGSLDQKEVPASGVYLYASAAVRDGETTMAEYDTGNNEAAVCLTGTYGRTGKETTLDVTLANGTATTATVTLKNNSLQPQPDQGTLLAVLLDDNGNVLETKTAMPRTALGCEETQTVDVAFTKLGADVTMLYAAGGTGLQELQFSGMAVSLQDFVENPEKPGEYVYTLEGSAPSSTVVSFISTEAVTVNGTAYDKTGSVEVAISSGSSTITVSTGGSTYILHLSRAGSGGGTYAITVESGKHGTLRAASGSAGAGTTVTLTATPESGYRLVSLTVTDRSGKTIAVSGKGSGQYTFVMPAGAVTVRAYFLPFTDLTFGAWYVDGVYSAYESGLMSGTGATTFSPNRTTTRAMIATILWRLEGSPEATSPLTFQDVDRTSWYAEAVRWAAEAGIVTGYSDEKFGPENAITREQMAAMLYRYAQYKGCDVSVGEETNILSYTDFPQLSEWAIPAMQWACGAEIITGTGASTLSPRGGATRAQVAVILTRYQENLAQ